MDKEEKELEREEKELQKEIKFELEYDLKDRYSVWRIIGYIFSILTIIGGVALSNSAVLVFHEMFAYMIIVGGIFSMFLIRIIGALDSIQGDLQYLARVKARDIINSSSNDSNSSNDGTNNGTTVK